MRAALVWACLCLLPGVVWAQEPGAGPVFPTGLVTIQWDYPLTEPFAHAGFLVESCVMQGSACAMVSRWSVPPVTLSQAVMRPEAGHTKCWQVRAIGTEHNSSPTARICLTGP
jgi:hypothetical protein